MMYPSWNLLSKLTIRGDPKSLIGVECFCRLYLLQGANNNIFAASDASVKNKKAAHAWILSTGKVTDIMDPLLNLHGYGPVHGPSQSLSSTRGELQGITAITIISILYQT
jgi:hypothetical protein